MALRRTTLITRRVLICTATTACLLGTRAAVAQNKPRIGIIGAGHIGGTLAKLWTEAGYHVMLSARDLGPVRELAAQLGPNAQAGTPAEAAAYGSVVLIAVPYSALPEIGKTYADQLRGKIVLDACNPSLKRDGPMAQEALDKGTGVVDPTYLPGTLLVRAFGTINYRALASEAHRSGELVGVPLASDNRHALEVASQLVRAAGFEPVIVGDLSTAKSFDTGQRGSKVHSASELRSILDLK